jgi:hypothetical protein
MFQKISRICSFLFFTSCCTNNFAQVNWIQVDSLFAPLPDHLHVYKSTDSLEGKPFIAYYASAVLKNKKLGFTTDTTYKRRLTPQQFFEKNGHPLLVVNGTFFSFATNQNLNLVIKDGKLVSYNVHTVPMRGKDTLQYRHPYGSAIGINKKRKADIAWLITDSSKACPLASQEALKPIMDAAINPSFSDLRNNHSRIRNESEPMKIIPMQQWKMKTAIGGGPVLLQEGEIKITNNEELKFVGKAIDDKHPRTCMGYTRDGRLIVMVIQGRFPGIAEGATLTQEAKLLKDIGCWEAINLDGGGSSCMLINGKETIKPSDKEGQRAVPAVFIIQKDKHTLVKF